MGARRLCRRDRGRQPRRTMTDDDEAMRHFAHVAIFHLVSRAGPHRGSSAVERLHVAAKNRFC